MPTRQPPGIHRGMMRLLAAAMLSLISLPALAGDWPMYRHDDHRTGITDETLKLPLRLAWRFDAPQPPRPAWPEPVRIINRMDFDYAPHPVIAAGRVFLASTSDDTLRCLDAATGKPVWRFTAGGPIRFAPQVAEGKVYFAADDGVIYCLDASTGQTAWTFRAAPTDEQFIGNGRMISRWPIRTGVLVADGALYAVAGFWPAEGIYVYSLDATTGKVNWCNDTSSIPQRGSGGIAWRATDPHSGEFSAAGLTPQGALLLDGDILVVPLANNAPASFNRKSGGLVNWVSNSSGGANVVMDGDMAYRLIQGKGPAELFGTRIPSRAATGRAVRVTDIPQPARMTPRQGQTDPTGRVSYLAQNDKTIVRAAYGLALAGGTLLRGLDGAVIATTTESDTPLWRANVDGEARELAISDGRLFVATDRGTLYCFSPDPGAEPAAPSATPEPREPPGPLASLLLENQINRGFALLVGDNDAKIATQLARQTELSIILPIPDPAAAAALRQKLLDETAFYGSRIHVVAVDRLDKLPFAKFFANAVIALPTPGLNGAELYRLTRPCGGLLLTRGLSPEQSNSFLAQAPTLPGERVQLAQNSLAIRRGQLPGARDWNTGDTPDRLVKWPLRPLWFGGPPSVLGQFSLIGQHPPIAAAGRYFILGDETLSAVDAYNGSVLWTRPIPTIYPHLRPDGGVLLPIAGSPKIEYPQITSILRRQVGADDKHVYLWLGASHFRDTSEGCIQLDVRDGRQIAMYAPWAPPRIVPLEKPIDWPLELDSLHSGSVKLAADDKGLIITIRTRTPDPALEDACDLFFDFRPPESRYGLYEKGVFQLIVKPPVGRQSAARCLLGADAAHPRVEVKGERVDGGTATTVRIPWSELDAITGGTRARSFGFAATLSLRENEDARNMLQARLFSDTQAAGINNGWAAIALPGASTETLRSKPAHVLGELKEMPTTWAATGAVNPEGIDPSLRQLPRFHPLTDEAVPRIFRSGTGACGRLTFSQTSTISRTTKLAIGFYDFDDDSGLRFFPGIASNCGVNLKAMSIQAALGLVISSEARSHCDCMIPIRTTVAFAQAERRLNEDWALFFDREVDTRVNRAAVNLGAPGDRRDETRNLWLAFPRSNTQRAFPLEPASRHMIFTAPPTLGSIELPIELEKSEGARAIVVNADRVPIEGTDKPWVFSSGYVGIQKATIKLDFLKPLTTRAVEQAGAPLGEPQIKLPFLHADVYLRHDDTALYITATRPAIADRAGQTRRWSTTTKGDDADVWQDDSFEVFLSDAQAARVLHLGISASGARFAALASEPQGSEKRGWNGAWKGTAAPTDSSLRIDLAIPLASLRDAGLDTKNLAVNVQMNQKDLSTFAAQYPGAESTLNLDIATAAEPMASLGPAGRTRCVNFAPLGLGRTPPFPTRRFTLRLGFAELENRAEGERVFDVSIQGRPVLKEFDIAKEAGGRLRAVVKELEHIEAGESLVIEFSRVGPPLKKGMPAPPLPLLNSLELYDESRPVPPHATRITP